MGLTQRREGTQHAFLRPPGVSVFRSLSPVLLGTEHSPGGSSGMLCGHTPHPPRRLMQRLNQTQPSDLAPASPARPPAASCGDPSIDGPFTAAGGGEKVAIVAGLNVPLSRAARGRDLVARHAGVGLPGEAHRLTCRPSDGATGEA